jgi:hypothetical protein
MSPKNDSVAPTGADSVATAVTGIEEELDFKPYLDAVNAGSSRTRSTVYVLVAMTVIILTGYRNTASPDWIDKRLEQFQIASACARQNNPPDCNTVDPSMSAQCIDAVGYSRKFLFTDSKHPALGNDEFCRELDDQINALIKVRTEALSIELPFFGMVIDVNDLGLISGIFLAFILTVLYVGVDREINNLGRAMERAKRAKTLKRHHESLELLLMTQVLAEKRGPTYGIHILLLAVVIIYGFVSWTDLDTSHVAVLLQGRFMGLMETAFDAFFFLLVLFLSIMVWIKQRKLDIKVDHLIYDLKMAEGLLNSQSTIS